MHDVMPAAPGPRVEIQAGTAFELLVGLSVLTGADREGLSGGSWLPRDPSGCSEPLRRAVDRVGGRSGEAWLHLLGLALELPSPSAGSLVAALAAIEGLALRRLLLGVHVPAWRSVAGAETLESAAAGDARAGAALLANGRYYAGQAASALEALLPLTPAETKRRLNAVVERLAAEILAPVEAELARVLERDAQRLRVVSGPPDAVIGAATRGYVYEPEPELDRVVLVPHVAARPWLLLCQHRETRLILFAAAGEEPDVEEVAARAVELGRALGDPRRIRILQTLAAGEASLAELAATAGLAKSTAHHHLALLRAAGLVTLRGNARGYWYALRPEAASRAHALLGDLLAPQV